VGERKWMFSLREGDGSIIDVYLGEVGDLVTLWLIQGCTFGPLEASASSQDGKLR